MTKCAGCKQDFEKIYEIRNNDVTGCFEVGDLVCWHCYIWRTRYDRKDWTLAEHIVFFEGIKGLFRSLIRN